jgi:hypothetical protein
MSNQLQRLFNSKYDVYISISKFRKFDPNVLIRGIKCLTEKILHSLVHRSGVMIDIRNSELKSKFEIARGKSKLETDNFINEIVKMTVGVPLKMIGNLKLDGSYPVVINKQLRNTRVISIGVGNNIVFDEGMASIGACVWMYDHTTKPKIKNKYKSRLFYSPIGVRGGSPIKNCLPLNKILDSSNNGSTYNQTILKMDCEGVEWDVFMSTPIKVIETIDQILVEFHDLDKIFELKNYKKYIKVLQKLNKKFVITYIAVNNFTPTIKLNDEINWPFTIEMHLLNKNLLKEFNYNQIMPGIPNNLGFTKKNWHLSPATNLSGWYKSA